MPTESEVPVAATDRRPEANRLRQLQSAAEASPQARALMNLQRLADARAPSVDGSAPVQARAREPVQRVYTGIKKLRIGVIHSSKSAGVTANALPAHTYVWILSNETVDKDTFPGIDARQKQATPDALVTANAGNVGTWLMQDENRSGGEVVARIFQSGPFQIPRRQKPTNRNELDFAFWRYAAFKSYIAWRNAVGAALGWPDPTSNMTLVETIDSDTTGISGATNEGRTEGEGQKKTVSADWLAEAGVYRWDWRDVAGHESMKGLFGDDTASRDAALQEFTQQYLEAEINARSSMATDMFNIYFPEPATRLSGAAVALLANSGFGSIAITKGDQIGHKRESIGLIAGLVHLDVLAGTNLSRAKTKLKFAPNYVATTGLGNRDGDFVRLFHEWYAKARTASGGFAKVNFLDLREAKNFDQSYLDPGQAARVNSWHTNTYDTMTQDAAKAGASFFHPKAN
ncbi:hypothetical protein [Paracoccus marinaquae]|uniref:Uncharacterized protein n=1 Tax=Paracoccus marinaquae TaxID=2841926 RepID=A0ABS6ADJ7_9RHOB|nr:hypothetical protein [Paracoccus marinaquae]MBU3028549.1 hypothetical protein [Paracoccus marinaquae]